MKKDVRGVDQHTAQVVDQGARAALASIADVVAASRPPVPAAPAVVLAAVMAAARAVRLCYGDDPEARVVAQRMFDRLTT